MPYEEQKKYVLVKLGNTGRLQYTKLAVPNREALSPDHKYIVHDTQPDNLKVICHVPDCVFCHEKKLVENIVILLENHFKNIFVFHFFGIRDTLLPVWNIQICNCDRCTDIDTFTSMVKEMYENEMKEYEYRERRIAERKTEVARAYEEMSGKSSLKSIIVCFHKGFVFVLKKIVISVKNLVLLLADWQDGEGMERYC